MGTIAVLALLILVIALIIRMMKKDKKFKTRKGAASFYIVAFSTLIFDITLLDVR